LDSDHERGPGTQLQVACLRVDPVDLLHEDHLTLPRVDDRLNLELDIEAFELRRPDVLKLVASPPRAVAGDPLDVIGQQRLGRIEVATIEGLRYLTHDARRLFEARYVLLSHCRDSMAILHGRNRCFHAKQDWLSSNAAVFLIRASCALQHPSSPDRRFPCEAAASRPKH